MPDPTPSTLIHFIEYAVAEYTLCNDTGTVETVSMDPGKVTCFRCRNSTTFKRIQKEGVGTPTPIKLSGVMAEAPLFQSLRDKLTAQGARRHRITVDVYCATLEEAEQVAAERLGPDEDYGFDYQLGEHTVTDVTNQR